MERMASNFFSSCSRVAVGFITTMPMTWIRELSYFTIVIGTLVSGTLYEPNGAHDLAIRTQSEIDYSAYI